MQKNFGLTSESEKPVSFGQRLAASEAFRALFREGMNLVEDSANYLDGPGRTDAKRLARAEALAYASESMRLTTRLMQLASWLLLQRAVNEGEMTQAQAATEKHRVKLSRQDFASGPDNFRRLPARLQELAIQSTRLQERVMHLDRLLYAKADMGLGRPLDVHLHMARLQEAFPAH
jgi:regulator of CtrA degradation